MTFKEYLLKEADKNMKIPHFIPLSIAFILATCIFNFWAGRWALGILFLVLAGVNIWCAANLIISKKKYIKSVEEMPEVDIDPVVDEIFISLHKGEITCEEADRKLQHNFDIVIGEATRLKAIEEAENQV